MTFRPNSDRPNFPDSGSDTERTGKRTWSFHERYASDPEFKRQVDEGRKRSAAQQNHDAVTAALAMPSQRKKLY